MPLQVKERLEALLEELKVVSCVAFAPNSFAQQRQLLAAPANYCSGEPPSLVTLNDIESQAPFSFGRPGILDEVLVPPSCGEEEFLQQWRAVQKLFFRHLRRCGRRCLWTAQFSVECTVRRTALKGPSGARPSPATRPEPGGSQGPVKRARASMGGAGTEEAAGLLRGTGPWR